MPIYGIPGSGHQVTAARAAYQVTAVSRRTSARPAAPSPASASAPVRISEGAELLAKLRVLHDSEPREFKRLMTSFAEEARAAADASTTDRKALGALAGRLAEAAREGNITPLVPSIDAGVQGRMRYPQELDAFVRPSESSRELFRSLLARVASVVPVAPTSSERRAR